MIVCIIIYILLLTALCADKKSDVFAKFSVKEKRFVFVAIFVSNLIATGMFAGNIAGNLTAEELFRNSYGEGSRVESYHVTVDGELKKEPIEIEVPEQEYTNAEIQEMFVQVRNRLDELILGENKSRDRVEKDLCLINKIEDYPVTIRWESDNYEVMDADGTIRQEKTKEEGTLVTLTGVLSYKTKEDIYTTYVMIYPRTLTGREKWIEAIRQSVAKQEETTREKAGFTLPKQVLGKEIQWEKKDMRGYMILVLGVILSGLFLWKNRQDIKEERYRRLEQMMRDYPDIVSKFTLLLSTGMTVKGAWIKIAQGYEKREQQSEKRAVYEEMCITCHEMQSGVSETEAYERFGKRCQMAIYMKFGALLSQNLKKGGKGLSELLKLEAIQAFENRKSMAKRAGEEAGTRLLVPMFGMLAVVMTMVIVPAFLSIQI